MEDFKNSLLGNIKSALAKHKENTQFNHIDGLEKLKSDAEKSSNVLKLKEVSDDFKKIQQNISNGYNKMLIPITE